MIGVVTFTRRNHFRRTAAFCNDRSSSARGTWLVASPGTVHVGASGLVFGWLVYLVLRGWFAQRLGQVLLGALLFLAYGGLLWGVLPGQPGVSWQGHLFGAVGGLVAARRLATRDERGSRSPTPYGS